MEKLKYKVYKVGGAVRDEIMGLKPSDLDYVMEAPSYETMKSALLEQGYKIFQERPEFFTIRCFMPDVGGVDMVLCRKEGDYTDGRRPDEVMVGTLMDDLARRDMTINAIAQDMETGEYIDPFMGQFDIQHRILRCVGDTKARFAEDSLRLLRAFRFAVTKGFMLHPDIVACLSDAAMIETLDAAKVERWHLELTKALEFDTLATLKMLERFPVLRDKLFTDKRLWMLPTLKPR